jgi:hypothetical protein
MLKDIIYSLAEEEYPYGRQVEKEGRENNDRMTGVG